MSVTARDEIIRPRIPPAFVRELPPRFVRDLRKPTVVRATVALERRADGIAVLAEDRPDELTFGGSPFGSGGGPVPCRGGNPTIHNTETIVVSNGANTDRSNLKIDLTYGSFGPGRTPEDDGASEIEIRSALGGRTVLETGRTPDAVALRAVDSRRAFNFSALDDDVDLLLGRRGPLRVDAGGGADTLGTTFPTRGASGLLVFSGGQGDDVFTGGPGGDEYFPGPGADISSLGAGADAVLLTGRSADTVDCGPGEDIALVSGRGEHEVRACEQVVDIDAEPVPVEPRNPPKAGESTLQKAARTLRRLTRD